MTDAKPPAAGRGASHLSRAETRPTRGGPPPRRGVRTQRACGDPRQAEGPGGPAGPGQGDRPGEAEGGRGAAPPGVPPKPATEAAPEAAATPPEEPSVSAPAEPATAPSAESPAATPEAADTAAEAAPAAEREALEQLQAERDQLRAQADQLQALLNERTQDLQRVTAEYANYRKRVERDRALAAEEAVANVFRALLPVFDDLDRAREHGELSEGVSAVVDQLIATSGKFGLTGIRRAGRPVRPQPARGGRTPHLPRRSADPPVWRYSAAATYWVNGYCGRRWSPSPTRRSDLGQARAGSRSGT